jgi:hypothetical protein
MKERKGCSGYIGKLMYRLTGRKPFNTEGGVVVVLDKDCAEMDNAQQYADAISKAFLSGEAVSYTLNEETSEFEEVDNNLDS